MSLGILSLDRGIYTYRLRAWRDPHASHTRDGTHWTSFKPEIDLIQCRLCLCRESTEQVRKRTMAAEWGWDKWPLQFDPIDEGVDKRLLRRLGGVEMLVRSHDTVTALAESVPSDVRQIVGRFASGQWRLLGWAGRDDRAVELLNSNPILGFALAHECSSCGANLLSRKQRELCGYLKLPQTECAVRLLRKLPPESCTPESFGALRRAMRSPELAKTLQHLPRLTSSTLLVLASPRLRRLVTPTYLRELTNLAGKKPAFDAFEQLGKLDALLKAFGLSLTRRVRPAAQLSDVRDILDSITASFDDEDPITLHKQLFPPPPLELPNIFVPITSAAALFREGVLQSHCVATYAKAILSGRAYVFRVKSPHRATLAIHRKAGQWVIDDFRRAHNHAVPGRLVKFTRECLSFAQGHGAAPPALIAPRSASRRHSADSQMLLSLDD